MVEVETLDGTMTWKGLSYEIGQHGSIVDVGVLRKFEGVKQEI
jgi:hypothetical protein